MNECKIAIFVEGQAEYIFVRDFLCAWYEYDGNQLGLECYEFRSGHANDVPYPFGGHESRNFYLIYNAGNDRSVMSKMLKETDRLKNAGFQLIVGLSDMFGDDYHQAAQNRTIREDINKRFKKVSEDIYKLAAKQYGKHESDVCSITSSLSKKDYQGLIDSGKCESFREFAEVIV